MGFLFISCPTFTKSTTMKTKTLLTLLSVISLLSISASWPDDAPASITTNGWTVNFCVNDTEEDHVRLEIGRGGNSNSHRAWTTWQKGGPTELTLPEDLRYANEIWIKAILKMKKMIICV